MAEKSLRWCWPMTPFDQVGRATMFWPDMKALMRVVNPSPFAHLGPESDDVRFDRIPKIGENLELRVSRLSSQGTEIKVIVPVVEGMTRAKIFRYYLPTDGDLALCRNLFPNSVDPGDPPWLQIEAELVVAGIPSTDFRQDTALMLLERLKASRKPFDQETPTVGEGKSVKEHTTETTEPQTGGKRPGINARMIEAMQANLEEVTGWSSTRWAKHLKCAKSSIVATQTWKDLTMARERVKAERAVDRRRKPKASDRNRTK